MKFFLLVVNIIVLIIYIRLVFNRGFFFFLSRLFKNISLIIGLREVESFFNGLKFMLCLIIGFL